MGYVVEVGRMDIYWVFYQKDALAADCFDEADSY
jgi:hypothetical protein